MAKLHKVELYIIDVNDKYSNLNEIMCDIENSTDCSLVPFNAQEVEIDWHDEIDLNYSNCPIENYRNYFEVEVKDEEELRKCTYTEGEFINYECELSKENKCFIGDDSNYYFYLSDNYWCFNGEWCCDYYNPECGCCRPKEKGKEDEEGEN